MIDTIRQLYINCLIVYTDINHERSNEQGISNQWVIDFGEKFKPIINEFFKKD